MLALQEFPRKILTRGIGRVNIGELLTRMKYNLQLGALRGNPFALEAPSPTRSGFPRNLRVTRHCGERSDATIPTWAQPYDRQAALDPGLRRNDGSARVLPRVTTSPGFPVRQVSRFARFPGSPGFPVRQVSRFARFPGSPGFPVRQVSRFARFPGSPGFPVRQVSRFARFPGSPGFPVRQVSRFARFPGSPGFPEWERTGLERINGSG